MPFPEVTVDQYIETIGRLAKSKSDLEFPSYKPEHAAIILTNIISSAENSVCIYDDELDGDLADAYPEFYNATDRFLENKKSMRIVVRNGRKLDTRIYHYLKNKSTHYSNLEVRTVSSQFMNSIKAEFQHDMNFAVGDRRSYRMETTQMVRGYREAFNSFNDIETAGKLTDIFDKNFNSCSILRF